MGWLSQEVAFRFDQYTIGATSTSLTTTTVDGKMSAFRAVIGCETAQCRFRYDGPAPTATVGHILNPGDRLVLEGRQNISNFSIIRTGGTSASLMVTLEAL